MNVPIAATATEVTDEFRWNLLQRRAQESRVRQAFDLFRQNGIEPILIKGFAAAVYYPESQPRISIDIDLAVPSADYDAALDIATSAATDGLAIDLHRELRHLDSANWSDLFEHSRFIDVDGVPIRVLRTEDHLRVLCVHWLTDGGANRERLWDIYYIIDNRTPDFDWDRFLGMVDTRRRRWLVCAIGLTSRYLGLDLRGTPVEDEARKLPLWLIRSVESEWNSETKHLPLESILTEPIMLMKQFKRRIRPSPLWATVQMEGSFDARTRIFYQIGSILKRIEPSYRRVSAAIKRRLN